MTLKLYCPDPDGPIPREVHMLITCDGIGDNDGKPCHCNTNYPQPNYMAQRRTARDDGWRKSGDKWLCPWCQ